MGLSDADRERELRAIILQKIRAEGSISFRDFMHVALYHPAHGYYTTLRGFGAEGDFITSPETHPVFGALLGRQVLDVWENLGRPTPFRMLELGGGSGALAQALLDWCRAEAPDLFRAVAYAIQEVSPSLRRVQRCRLSGYPVAWAPRGQPDLVLANEVLDAMPVHRVTVKDGQIRELRVGVRGDGSFDWVLAPGAPAAVKAYFARLGVAPPDDATCEVNVSLGRWARRLAARLTRGVAVLLDYGYLAEDLFARRAGTLLTYFRHTMGSDPLTRVGRQDISTHVDFTTLASEATAAGLSAIGVTSQRRLLERLGIEQYRRLLGRPADQRALHSLVDRRGLGRIGVLFLARGIDEWRPAGLQEGLEWPSPTWLPSVEEPADSDFLDQWQEAFGDGRPIAPST